MLGLPTRRAPDGSLLQPFHPAAPIYLGKHEALKLGGDPVNGDGARHARRQLVTGAEKLLTAEKSVLLYHSPAADTYSGWMDLTCARVLVSILLCVVGEEKLTPRACTR